MKIKRIILIRFIAHFMLPALLFCSACSSTKQLSKGADHPVIYPPPPAAPKIQFLTSFSNSSDVSGKRSSFVNYVLGKSEEESILKPYGISAAKGRIYICDSMLGGLEIINLAENEMSVFKPGGAGELKKPINCTVDSRGNLYVADAERRQIVIFNENGEFLKSVGGSEACKPTDVCIAEKKIWVCDLQKRNIKIYDLNSYALLDSFPKVIAGDSESLYSPTNIFYHDGLIYISDLGDFRIKVYTTDGEFVRSIGSFGKQPGHFVRPKGIAVDRDNHLYVVDAGFENIQIFNKEGQLLLFFGGSYKKPGDMWLPAQVFIDYANLPHFEKYVDNSLNLKYLIYVTNQFGPDKINVYGFVERKKTDDK